MSNFRKLALILIMIYPTVSLADDLDGLRSTVRSQICPASSAKYDLIRNSCAAERAKMTETSNQSGRASETYNAFMRCQNSEDEQNKLINQYNSFMNRCEAAEREKRQQTRQDDQQAAPNKNQSVNKQPISDIDRRLQQARSKSDASERKSQVETQNAARDAAQANQRYEALSGERAEEERKRREWYNRPKPKLTCFGGAGGSTAHAGYILCRNACEMYHPAKECEATCYNSGSSEENGKSCFYDR